MNDIDLYDIDRAFPICAVCNKPVDAVHTTYDPNYDGKVFTVYCHGQAEQQILGAFTMMDASEITFGKAFNYPKLPMQEKE